MNFFAAAAASNLNWMEEENRDAASPLWVPGERHRNQGVSFMKGANAPAKYVTASSITSNS